jgi:predicted RNase H-like nuclease (RuvC/YqgF family)
MARATTGTAKARKRPSGRIHAAASPTAKLAPSSKEELRARIEKLERANANLRIKNKDYRRLAEEAAERLEALQSAVESKLTQQPTSNGESAPKRSGRKAPEPAAIKGNDHSIDGME